MPAPQALRDRKRVAGESHHRPWRCTLERAIYCPLHGDCTCSKTPDRETLRDSPVCPLHGVKTEHPMSELLVA